MQIRLVRGQWEENVGYTQESLIISFLEQLQLLVSLIWLTPQSQLIYLKNHQTVHSQAIITIEEAIARSWISYLPSRLRETNWIYEIKIAFYQLILWKVFVIKARYRIIKVILWDISTKHLLKFSRIALLSSEKDHPKWRSIDIFPSNLIHFGIRIVKFISWIN